MKVLGQSYVKVVGTREIIGHEFDMKKDGTTFSRYVFSEWEWNEKYDPDKSVSDLGGLMAMQRRD